MEIFNTGQQPDLMKSVDAQGSSRTPLDKYERVERSIGDYADEWVNNRMVVGTGTASKAEFPRRPGSAN